MEPIQSDHGKMMIAALMICLALAPAVNAQAQDAVRGPLSITYVGNTGFLVEADGKKIAIDALFGGLKSEIYDVPSDSVVALMTAGQAPFDSIDVIAVTHWHADHFSAAIVAQHMRNNPAGVVLCSPQVAEKLAEQTGYHDIENRIHIVRAGIDSIKEFSQAGISARIRTSHHGSYYDVDSSGQTVDRHRATINLEYLFTVDGYTILHSGDAAMDDLYKYAAMGLGRDSIDVAFVQKWACSDMPTFREKLVRDKTLPKHIFFTHMAPGVGARLANESACGSHRGATFPAHGLETWTLEPTAR